MKNLMYFCRNWGDQDCHADVSQYGNLKGLTEGDNRLHLPGLDDLKRMDDICRQCEARFFEMKERICLICGGRDFNEVKGLIITDEKDRKGFENYYLKCRQCETPSVLKKES